MKIIPVEPPGKTIDLAKEDSALAFEITRQLRVAVADVVREDKYAFSLRRMRGDDGYWAIYQRAGQSG